MTVKLVFHFLPILSGGGGKSSGQQTTVFAGVSASAEFSLVDYVLIEIQLNRPLTITHCAAVHLTGHRMCPEDGR
ncbi:hypothetical protein V5799_003834 [Amblyomma americanum]|uniref:Uncharacterized protein n=1 Tax=Amblyomma americanum TaxID=6943 RepID=A0AAQ4D7U4_AMBAM